MDNKNITLKATQWVEWVEPFIDSEPVFMRVTSSTAIAAMKKAAATKGHTYEDDQRALEDFITVHWAHTVSQPTPAGANPRKSYEQGQLDEFYKMKNRRPADPTYWDMHEEKRLIEATKTAKPQYELSEENVRGDDEATTERTEPDRT